MRFQLSELFYVAYFTVVSIGVPLKLLHEGEGHVVTVELKNGETYRGMLTEAEDSMNCQMKEGAIFCFYSSTLEIFLWMLMYLEDLLIYFSHTVFVISCFTAFSASMAAYIFIMFFVLLVFLSFFVFFLTDFSDNDGKRWSRI
jgi:LSM domain